MNTMRRLTAAVGRVRWLAMAILAAGVLQAGSLAQACPLCKQALENSEQAGGDMVAGYFWSILFMMSMPFLLLSSFSGYMYLAVRKARRERDAQQAAAQSTPAQPTGSQTEERELVEV